MTQARHIEDWDAFDAQREAGTFSIGHTGANGDIDFWYCCPCGCGVQGVLSVGKGRKPAASPSWSWNGSIEKPTLVPSVNHVGHWHGWLTDGLWKVC